MLQLFSEKLRYLRRQQGMTQAELAERLALASHAHIANLEAGCDVASLALVLRVAALFGVSTDYLLRDTIPVEKIAAAAVTTLAAKEETPRSFGPQLRGLRVQHGFTQRELARQLGLARQGYISNLEIGRKVPSLELVVQIADLFGVTTDYLLHNTGEEAPS